MCEPVQPIAGREDHDELRSEPVSRNPYRLAISPTIRGRHRGLGIPLDQAKRIDRADVRVGACPGAGRLGVRREHLEFDLGLRFLGSRVSSVHLVRGGDPGVPGKSLFVGNVDRHSRPGQRTRPVHRPRRSPPLPHVASPPRRRGPLFGHGNRVVHSDPPHQQRGGRAGVRGPRRAERRTDDVPDVFPDHGRIDLGGTEERVSRIPSRRVRPREDRPPVRGRGGRCRRPLRIVHPAPVRHYGREPLPRVAGVACAERERYPHPNPRALLTLDWQLDPRFHLLAPEPPRTFDLADFRRRESRRLLLHRLATRGGPQLHPGVAVEVPLRPRLAARPPADLAGVQHATPPRRHHGPNGRPRRAARLDRHDDRRRDLVRSARTRLAAVPPCDLAEGGDPIVQGAVQRGPPPARPHRDGELTGSFDSGVPGDRIGPSRGPGLATPGVDPGRDLGVGGGLVALSKEASEPTGDPGERGLKGNGRCGVPPARIPAGRPRIRAYTATQPKSETTASTNAAGARSGSTCERTKSAGALETHPLYTAISIRTAAAKVPTTNAVFARPLRDPGSIRAAVSSRYAPPARTTTNRAVIRTEFQMTSMGSRANAKTSPEPKRNTAAAAATNNAGRALSPRHARVQPRPLSIRKMPTNPIGPMTVGSATLSTDA